MRDPRTPLPTALAYKLGSDGKGKGWGIFTGAVTESGVYEVKAVVPTAACTSGASAVPAYGEDASDGCSDAAGSI